MSGTAIRWGLVMVALLLAQLPDAAAQGRPTYKCIRGGKVVYTQIPCRAGAKPLGEDGRPRVNVRYQSPPQDRAVAARRGPLSVAARKECSALDHTLRDEEQGLKAKGSAATLEDEMPLVRAKKRFRELKC